MAGNSNFITFLILSISVCVQQYLCAAYLVGPRCQRTHPVTELSKEAFFEYGQLKDVRHLRDAVENILIPRVVGEDGHTRVREYISDSMHQMGWSLEYDAFPATVPILGDVHYHNIIAKLNPEAERFLVLTCHYDGKYKQDYTITGALDAVPCAMLLNMAHVLQRALNPFRTTKLSLMFIFFDGHESPNDYDPAEFPVGARHLAGSWKADGTLNKLDILVELDMIGLADTTFYSFFANTDEWFNRFIALEDRLSFARMLRYRYPNQYFETDRIRSYNLKGDQKPFLEEKLPILHLTPKALPRELHTERDNESIINYTATENISLIIRLFTMEYLLSGIMQ
ncbi:glutaminyl-peptide cyclotransferase-like [Eurosta solidaginis]|uniref:glutaminyl-peptide cyclotransferase-like n=1 Tax=Eurosta solidaginis TaxID=178769 RepID=UPI003530F35D